MIAREIKGQPTQQILKIHYSTTEELITKLEEKLQELKGNTHITSHEK
jgi:hypothetical protein